MFQCRAMAVFALDDHMRIQGHTVEHIPMAGLAGFVPLVFDRDVLPVLDSSRAIQPVRESMVVYAEILRHIEIPEDEESNDDADDHQ